MHACVCLLVLGLVLGVCVCWAVVDFFSSFLPFRYAGVGQEAAADVEYYLNAAGYLCYLDDDGFERMVEGADEDAGQYEGWQYGFYDNAGDFHYFAEVRCLERVGPPICGAGGGVGGLFAHWAASMLSMCIGLRLAVPQYKYQGWEAFHKQNQHLNVEREECVHASPLTCQHHSLLYVFFFFFWARHPAHHPARHAARRYERLVQRVAQQAEDQAQEAEAKAIAAAAESTPGSGDDEAKTAPPAAAPAVTLEETKQDCTDAEQAVTDATTELNSADVDLEAVMQSIKDQASTDARHLTERQRTERARQAAALQERRARIKARREAAALKLQQAQQAEAEARRRHQEQEASARERKQQALREAEAKLQSGEVDVRGGGGGGGGGVDGM